MKKILIVLALTLLVISSGCTYGTQYSEKSDNHEIVKKITYFKDKRTGLCYAVVNSHTAYGYSVTSFTCVPCDSLKNKNIEITIIN